MGGSERGRGADGKIDLHRKKGGNDFGKNIKQPAA